MLLMLPIRWMRTPNVIFINILILPSLMTEQQILKKLDKIEQELLTIKEHMADIDSVMTEEDYQALLAYRKEKTTGRLASHTQLKKELGL